MPSICVELRHATPSFDPFSPVQGCTLATVTVFARKLSKCSKCLSTLTTKIPGCKNRKETPDVRKRLREKVCTDENVLLQYAWAVAAFCLQARVTHVAWCLQIYASNQVIEVYLHDVCLTFLLFSFSTPPPPPPPHLTLPSRVSVSGFRPLIFSLLPVLSPSWRLSADMCVCVCVCARAHVCVHMCARVHVLYAYPPPPPPPQCIPHRLYQVNNLPQYRLFIFKN